MLYQDNFDDLSSFDFWISSPSLLGKLSSYDNFHIHEEEEERKLNKFFKQKLYESRDESFETKTYSLLSSCVDILKTGKLSSLNQIYCLKLLASLSLENSAKDSFKTAGLLEWVESFANNDKPEIFFEAWKILQNLNTDDNKAVKYVDYIYPLIPPWKKEEPLVDVILVHGIKGRASWTWRQHDSKMSNPVLQQNQRQHLLLMDNSGKDDVNEGLLNGSYSWIWPLDWLKHRISMPFRIIAVDYPAGWRNSDHEQRNEKDLTAVSEDILRKLKLAGVGSRPIIWVTHSMGGLIVKTMFKLEVSREKEETSPTDILSSTRAVIFLSVPHFGAPLASWICYLSPLFRPPPFIYDLKAGCPKLMETHRVFVKLCRSNDIEVLSLNETKPLPIVTNGPKVFFVPPKYGNPEIGKFYEVDASHLDVCKPTGRSDEIFKIIEEFIMNIFQNLSVR